VKAARPWPRRSRLNEANLRTKLLLATATRPAQSGATALVPPITSSGRLRDRIPGRRIGVASHIRTPRPPVVVVAPAPALSLPRSKAKTLLTPPPVAPSLLANSFHTTRRRSSLVGVKLGSAAGQHIGLEAGKSTLLPVPPSVDPCRQPHRNRDPSAAALCRLHPWRSSTARSSSTPAAQLIESRSACWPHRAPRWYRVQEPCRYWA